MRLKDGRPIFLVLKCNFLGSHCLWITRIKTSTRAAVYPSKLELSIHHTRTFSWSHHFLMLFPSIQTKPGSNPLWPEPTMTVMLSVLRITKSYLLRWASINLWVLSATAWMFFIHSLRVSSLIKSSLKIRPKYIQEFGSSKILLWSTNTRIKLKYHGLFLSVQIMPSTLPTPRPFQKIHNMAIGQWQTRVKWWIIMTSIQFMEPNLPSSLWESYQPRGCSIRYRLFYLIALSLD